MKAIVCENFAPPIHLSTQTVPEPTLGPDQIMIDIKATGLGYVDALMVAGLYQIKPPLPFIPGNEIAGVICEVGTDVTQFNVGDRVLAMPSRGGLAEKIAVRADTCIPIPDRASFEAAAAFLVNYCTAYHGLITLGQVKAGESVLILGASGGVGTAAIDLAKSEGAFVIAAASSEAKLDMARRQGADLLINYSESDWRDTLKKAMDGRPLNLVYDPVGGDFAEAGLRSLAPGGRFLVVGFATGTIPKLPANLTLLKQVSVIGVNWGGHIAIHPEASAPVVNELVDRIDRSTINPLTGQHYSLDETGKAMTAMLERQAIGKTIIRQE